MIFRELGTSGIRVSRLGYGSMGLRGPKTWGIRVADEETSDQILNQVLDAGINFIDTSPDYGIAEERIGKYIGHRRDEFILATKCGCVYHTDEDQLVLDHHWTKKVVSENLQKSLLRLKTDSIDILQFHGGTAKELADSGLVDLLQAWKKEGKIRALGVSTKIPEAKNLLELGVFDVFQVPFSCLQPDHLTFIVEAANKGAGIIARGGIGQGGPEAEIQRAEKNAVWDKLRLVDLLTENQKPADLILQWTLSFRHIHTAIVGTANPIHLEENVQVESDSTMTESVFQEILERICRSYAISRPPSCYEC